MAVELNVRSSLALFASFYCRMVCTGFCSNFGVFVRHIQVDFKSNRPQTVLIGSITEGCLCLSGFCSGFLYKRFGSQPIIAIGGLMAAVGLMVSGFVSSIIPLYFTTGVMTGFGLGLVYMTSASVVPEFFVELKLFASAFSTVGSAIGTMTFSHIFMALEERFGWQLALAVSSLFPFATAILSLFLRHKPTRDESITAISQLDLSLFCNVRFCIVSATVALYEAALMVLYMLINAHGALYHVTDTQVAVALTMFGCANLASRLLSSVLCQWTDFSAVLLYTVGNTLMAVGFFGFCFANDFLSMVLCAAVIGAGYGVSSSQVAGCYIECLDADQLPNAFGYTYLLATPGNIMIPPLAGWLSSNTAPFAPFLLAGSATTAGAVLAAILYMYVYDKPEVPPTASTPLLPVTSAREVKVKE